jgi:predicted MFS family arabinose efflux permease
MAIALAHAIYWSVVARTAAGLVQPGMRGPALGIVYAGASLSSVAGLPAATWLGQHTSWRVATLAAAALGLVALVIVATLLPGDGNTEIPSDVGRHADGRRYAILLVTLALAVTGTFATLTYVSPFLTSVAGFPQRDVGPILFVQGAAGVTGVWLASRHVTRRPRAVLLGGVAVVSCAMLALAAAGHVQVAVVALLAVYGCGFSALVVGGQNRLLDVVPGNPDVASAGYSATFNIGIGGGALVGGLLLPSAGVRSTPLVGGALAAAALAVLLAEPALATRGSRGRHARA